MRTNLALALAVMTVTTVVNAAINRAPSNYATDDIITLIYDPGTGSLVIDNPAGEVGAADAITTFELVASEDFFTGPRPAELSGLFDVWNPRKAFRLFPAGFFDAAWPEGSLATGVTNPCEILTLNGSFLSGGALVADMWCLPEPSSLVLLIIGGLGVATRRRLR
jgi:hypothetical protein